MWQNKLTKEKYEGNFLNGEKDGKGKYTFQDGSIYEGNFKNDVPEGEGTIIKDS